MYEVIQSDQALSIKGLIGWDHTRRADGHTSREPRQVLTGYLDPKVATAIDVTLAVRMIKATVGGGGRNPQFLMSKTSIDCVKNFGEPRHQGNPHNCFSSVPLVTCFAISVSTPLDLPWCHCFT